MIKAYWNNAFDYLKTLDWNNIIWNVLTYTTLLLLFATTCLLTIEVYRG